jgi:Tol biopolymer transport system component
MYRERRRRRLLVATVIVAVVGVLAAWLFVLVLPLLRPTPATSPRTTRASASGEPSPSPNCASAVLPDAARLGSVAWVSDGALTVIDLGTCRQAALVASGAKPPVRFSADGKWLAFGDGRLVPAAGGPVTRPFGSPVNAWAWSPAEDVLAGVTAGTGVLIVRPGGQPETLLAEGSAIGHLAFAPDGVRLAVDRLGTGVQVVDVTGGKARTVFHEPDPTRSPKVAGWSPDGGWVLYWRGPVGQKPAPLDAVQARGGPWVNLFDPVLPYGDFLSACGDRVALSAGAGQAVSVGKQILLTRAPGWQFHNLTHDYTRSWVWPACSPDGRWVAAVATPNHEEEPGFAAARALWLIAADGSSRHRVIPGGETAPEYPRWSRDGRALLVVVRSGSQWSSPGSLYLFQVDPDSGRLVRKVGPVADLGAADGPGGHQEWAALSDWYRPAEK